MSSRVDSSQAERRAAQGQYSRRKYGHERVLLLGGISSYRPHDAGFGTLRIIPSPPVKESYCLTFHPERGLRVRSVGAASHRESYAELRGPQSLALASSRWHEFASMRDVAPQLAKAGFAASLWRITCF